MAVIESVAFGEIRIGGRTYYSDVVVYWDGTFELKAKQLVFDTDEMKESVKKRGTEAVVVGTGIQGSLKVGDGALELARQKKVKLFVERSAEAVDVFNGLVADGKRAVAYIHTTG